MIDLIFSLLNFGILIAIFVYAILRYALPLLKNSIAQEKQLLENLHDEHRQVLVEKKQVDEGTLAQETDCGNFFNKINEWKSVVEKAAAQKNAEHEHMLRQTEEKLRLQSEQYNLAVLYQHIEPTVIDILEKELKQHFEDERAGHAYIESILKRLKK